jgi:hypothetical protein
MVTATKSMIALGVLGAMFVGTPSASYARDARAHAGSKSAVVVHKQRHPVSERGAYARSPRYGFDPWWQPPPYYPNVYERPFLKWNPYGMRWEGMD